MHPMHVKEEFARIEHCIEHAAHICQQTSDAPEDLRQALTELDSESERARDMLPGEQNGNRIVQAIDVLARLSDRAMQACRQGGNEVDEALAKAVREAHIALAELKRKLH